MKQSHKKTQPNKNPKWTNKKYPEKTDTTNPPPSTTQVNSYCVTLKHCSCQCLTDEAYIQDAFRKKQQFFSQFLVNLLAFILQALFNLKQNKNKHNPPPPTYWG